MTCPLCREDGGHLVARDAALRIVRVDDADYPGFFRVIWNAHVAEMSELTPDQQRHLLDAVLRVERALRQAMAPRKINLASLGNQVPHLHWHVIPRFDDDPHFPQPIWAGRQRDTPAQIQALRRQAAEAAAVAIANGSA